MNGMTRNGYAKGFRTSKFGARGLEGRRRAASFFQSHPSPDCHLNEWSCGSFHACNNAPRPEHPVSAGTGIAIGVTMMHGGSHDHIDWR